MRKNQVQAEQAFSTASMMPESGSNAKTFGSLFFIKVRFFAIKY
jgi:hypothetical protein